MDYECVSLKKILHVQKIYSVHYFEYMKDFVFEGESHDFWEFACVDKGEVNIFTATDEFSLKKDEIIFHKPNEFHGVKSNGRIAPNLVVMSFECTSGAMNYFNDRILTISGRERELIARIIAEAKQAFATPMDDPYLKKIERASSQPLGSEHLIGLYLEELLICLLREGNSEEVPRPIGYRPYAESTAGLYCQIIEYLENHIGSQLTIEQICSDNLLSRSQLQRIFRENHSCGVMDYFSRMKIDHAKQLIRNKDLNFTQIADTLGYSSIHYFSRHFKSVTGMSPSEYSSSIKKITERY